MSRLLLPRGYRNVESLQKRLVHESEEVWIKKGQKRALNLFWAMSSRVPAYKDFLRSHKFSSREVRSIEDFKKIPPIDKDNYLKKYPKQMLCWDGEFAHGQWVISTTSGSTGKPFYFPREQSQDWQYAISAELYLRTNFNIQNKTTLYIVAFPMGAWIGGVFTYEALKIIAENGGYDLSIITPGIHKQEVINAVLQFSKDFDQIIIGAYAPFLKDILDDGLRAGINWKNYDIGFVFSAEAFTEYFRDYVINLTDPKDELRFSLNHYGTVDLGTMSHETPESIMIRRHLVKEHALTALFQEERRQPTFTQYNPELFFFEELSNNLLCTAYSGIPLVRYDLKDYGGILTKSTVYKKLSTLGYDVPRAAETHRIKDTVWNLPFLYVYERNDLSVSYYAFLIYPDMVRRALQDVSLHAELTGKFTMFVDYNKEGRQQLHIHCECKHNVKSSEILKNKVKEIIHANLVEESSEYRETYSLIGQAVKPVIHLWPYEDPIYFKSGTKQKWVIKPSE